MQGHLCSIFRVKIFNRRAFEAGIWPVIRMPQAQGFSRFHPYPQEIGLIINLVGPADSRSAHNLFWNPLWQRLKQPMQCRSLQRM